MQHPRDSAAAGPVGGPPLAGPAGDPLGESPLSGPVGGPLRSHRS